MDLDRYLTVSAQIKTDDLDWDLAARVGLTDDEVFILTYFSDIETQTIMYMRDLLHLPTALELEVTAFLSMWNYEEYFHGRALAKLLEVCGHSLAKERIAAVRKSSTIQETIEANLIDLYGKLGYDYPRDGAPAAPPVRTREAKRERLA